MKEYLLTAGPTPVPERVLLAMARPMLYHRAPAFTECLREVQDSLRWLMQTKQLPLVLGGSGTAGMDAAVCNFLKTGDKAVVVRGGKFGERWGKICQAYGVECVFIDVEWGKGVDPKAVAEALDKNPGVRAVYATASETSTATKHDVEAIARVVAPREDVILCVEDKGETAFTPPVSLVVGLRESLRMLKEETLPGVWNRHERLAKATRAASGGLGLELFSSSPTNAVTAYRVPNGIDGTAVIKQMRTRYGITIAGGQDHLKGKIVRIAHIGYVSEFDVITAISGLEMTLSDLGYVMRPGSGVAAAQATFAETRRT